MDQNPNQKCLLVLGMHRSGTSAISGLLHYLGIDFGKSIVDPSYDNPKGFFENRAIQSINNQLLAALGVSWDHPNFLPENWWKKSSIQALQIQARETILEEFKGTTFFAIKDPRICYLFPFWEEILQSLNISINCVITIRASFEVAASLQKRNGLAPSKSHLIHLTHLFSAEQYSKAYPRLFIRYADVVRDSVAVATKMKKFYSLDSLKPSWRKDIENFISKDLRHHLTSNSQELDTQLVPYQKKAFRQFEVFEDINFIQSVDSYKIKHQQYLQSIDGAIIEEEVKPFNVVYSLFKLAKNTQITSILSLLKSIFLHPIRAIQSIRSEHLKTLKKALKHEPPDVIVKNIIKLISSGNKPLDNK